MMPLSFRIPIYPIAMVAMTSLSLMVSGCQSTTTDQYQASAVTTYTWHVDYEGQNGRDRPPRIEKFASTSLENKNGQQPAGAVTGPDDQGLWWPDAPPRPTVDELEERQQSQEIIGQPRLQKNVEYRIIFRLPGEENRTLPTRYDVYRQVVKAYEDQIPLEFVMDPTESMVTQAKPATR